MKIQIDPIKMKGLCEQCNKISEVYKVTVSNENRSMSKLLCGSCATKAMKYVENMNQTTRAAASADAGTDADHQNLTPQTAKKGLRHSPQKRIITALLALLIVLSGAVIGTIAVIKSNKAKKGADSVDEASIGAIYYQETPAEHIAQTDVGIMYADNELLVVAKEGTAKAEVEQLASKYDAAIVGFIEATGDYQWQLNRVFSKDDLDACAAEIENEDIIDSACPNYIFEILENSVNDDINYGKEWKGDLENQTDIKGKSWGVEAIKAPAAWKLMDENKSKISPVAVGVIDNGFDESHDDLPKPKFFYNNSFNYRYSDLENQSDDMSHGTHVAGIFAANGTNSEGICGVYPYANDGGLFLASWDHENEYAENKSFVYLKVCFAELVLRNVKVINCSFGSGFGNKLMYMLERPEMENEAETYARDLAEVGKLFGDYFERFLDLNYDFVIVASAGNNSNEEVKIEIEINNNVETIAYETNDMLAIYNSILTLIPETQSKIYNRIIVVGAIDEAFHRCDFSDVGERVDIYAPGKKIYSTVPKNDYSNTHWQKNDDGKKITDDCSGTSQAAPHVAGVAASVWSMNKKLSGADVKSIVKNSINTEHLDLPIIDMEQAVKVAFGSIDNESFTEHLDPNHGAIMGWVVDRDSFTVSADNGIETGAITDAEIIVENAKTGDKTDGTYINDYNGHFEIILPPGKYNLTVNAAGYDPYTTPEPVEVNAQQVTYLDDWIKLKKKNTDKPNAEEIIDIYLKQYLTDILLMLSKMRRTCFINFIQNIKVMILKRFARIVQMREVKEVYA